MYCDYHLHPHHSADGKMSLREMALSAIEKGLDEICPTAHFDIDFPSETLNFECDLIDYVEDVERYSARYADKIRIKTGLEVGMQAGREDVYARSRACMEGLRFDYLIGSIHWLGRENGEPREKGINPVWGYGATKQQVQQRYTRALLQCAQEFPEFDCLGHITYYCRQNPGTDVQMRYADAADEFDMLFRHLIQNGKGFEINASSLAKMGFCMPDLDIVSRYRELGGEIVTIGSDAHWAKDVGSGFTGACEMLKASGMRYFCTYEDHKPTFHPLP